MRFTVEEMRELSLRSRKEQRRGAAAIAGCMLLVSMVGWVFTSRPEWGTLAAYAAAAIAGLLLVAYAHAAGQTRGAFRRVFRDAKRARTADVDSPAQA